MTQLAHPSSHESAAGGPSISVGSGWIAPAALVAIIVATAYLPAHQQGPFGVATVIALMATLYSVAVIVALPRLLRALVLRLAGRPFHVVLLGATGEELDDPGTPARWRMTAILAGTVAAVLAALASLWLAVGAPPDGYGHAIAVVSADTATLVALGTLVPAPPFVGWSLVLAVVDAAGVPRASRAKRAAGLARAIGTPLILAATTLATLADPLMALPLGLVLVAYVWRSTAVAVGREALVRFLEAHRVGDLVRPPIARVRPDDPIPSGLFAEAGPRGAVFVERGGFLVGAIGTHRLRHAADRLRSDGTWAGSMAPVAALSWLDASEPATRVLQAIRALGVVLVLVDAEIQAIEEDDLFEQAAAWSRGGTSPARREAPDTWWPQ